MAETRKKAEVKCPHCGEVQLQCEGSITAELAICNIYDDLSLSYFVADSNDKDFEVNDSYGSRLWCFACKKECSWDDVFDQAPVRTAGIAEGESDD